MRDVDRREFQVLHLILVDEPFQRHRVPHNLVHWVDTGFLDGLLHVVIPHGILAPALVLHEVMAETACVHDHPVITQIFERLDEGFSAFLVNHTVRKQADHRFAVLTILMVETGFHAEDQV